jgi:hypothetical protein
MSTHEYGEWQRLYVEALLEVDAGTRVARLEAAEAAMYTRLQELRTVLDGHAEGRAIQDALLGLLASKRDMMEHPNRK